MGGFLGKQNNSWVHASKTKLMRFQSKLSSAARITFPRSWSNDLGPKFLSDSEKKKNIEKWKNPKISENQSRFRFAQVTAKCDVVSRNPITILILRRIQSCPEFFDWKARVTWYLDILGFAIGFLETTSQIRHAPESRTLIDFGVIFSFAKKSTLFGWGATGFPETPWSACQNHQQFWQSLWLSQKVANIWLVCDGFRVLEFKFMIAIKQPLWEELVIFLDYIVWKCALETFPKPQPAAGDVVQQDVSILVHLCQFLSQGCGVGQHIWETES